MEGFGLLQYPLNASRVLEKVGNVHIKTITIKRSPVPKLLTGALSVFSVGKFGKRMYKHYDELFHLYCELTLVNGKKVLVEKNERINVELTTRNSEKTETEAIKNIPPNLTLEVMLSKTRKSMGDSLFFEYDSATNNCQDFLLRFLKVNNIGSEDDYTFIKQDIERLFKKLSYLQKFARSVTDLGASVGDTTDTIQFMSGRGFPIVN